MAGCSPGERPSATGSSRTLTIGTDATYPPLESLKGEEFVGYDIDLGNAVGRELGAKVTWVNSGFDGIFAALQAKKFDMVISSVTITEDRKKSLAFSDPYYTAGQALASRKEGTAYSETSQLAGKTVGIQINTTAKEVLKKHQQVKVREYNSIDLALLDLQNGGIDAVMTDSPVLKYMLHRGFDSLRLAGTLLTEEHYGIVMRPEDRELVQEVNGALKRLEEKGEIAKLRAKWFGEQAAGGGRQSTWQLVRIILPQLAKAAVTTVELTALAILFGLPLGLFIALLRLQRIKPLAWLASVYVEVLRGTPLLVQIFTVYYVLPATGIRLAQWPAALLAFSLNSSAYIAEIFRAGIQSIDRGQMEAARSLGMPYGLAMRLIILPQAFRRVLPPLTNEGIALLKDTSLVSVIAMVELTRQGQQLTGQLAAPMVIWPLVGLFYLVLTLPLTRLAAFLERKWAVGGRHA
jgi:His/Glu/Gln/Arg/opine family amino acid ABC transporter permease subunit